MTEVSHSGHPENMRHTPSKPLCSTHRPPAAICFATGLLALFLTACGERKATPPATAEPPSEPLLGAMPYGEDPVSQPALSPILARTEAAADAGWDSEVFSAAAQDALHRMLAEKPAPLVADAFQCGATRPQILTKLFADPFLEIFEGSAEATPIHRGPNGWSAAREALFAPFNDKDHVKETLEKALETYRQSRSLWAM